MEAQELNIQFLLRVYDEADGFEDRPVETASFGLIHGLTFKQITDMVDALVGEGLLVVHTPTHVKLTHKGVIEVERLLDEANRAELDEVEQATPDADIEIPEAAAAPKLQPGRSRVVFLSHQNEHQELAMVIKQQLEASFGNQVRVLLSSDVYTIPGGEQWKERIVKVIKSLSVHLLLCDEGTLETPWINFEAGASWLRGKPIIPVCFGHLDKDKLPKPYDEWPSLDLEDGFADEILTILEGHLGPKYRAKREPGQFMDAIKAALIKM
jgi:hypothetical protein